MVATQAQPEAGPLRAPAKRRAITIGCSLFVLAVFLPLLRQRGSRSWQTIWYEDGSIFYEQAKLHGASVLFRGYNGYLQLPSRVLGLIGTALPIRDLPVYFALTSTIIGALAALFVYHYCEVWVTSVPIRLTLAALVVLMPALGYENTADITDVIWFFLMALPWALISLRERRRDVAIRSAAAFIAATSSILCVYCIPFALGYALYRRTRETWLVVVAFGVGLLVQIPIALRSKRISSEPAALYRVKSLDYLFGHPSLSLLVRFTGLRVFVELVTGGKGVPVDWSSGDTLLIAACVTLGVVVLVLFMWGAARVTQVLAAVFIVYALGLFGASVWESGLGGSGFRYSVVPIFLLASAMAVLVAPSGAERMRMVAVIGRPVFAAYMAVVIIIGFPVTNARSVAPTWQSALANAQAHCIGAAPDKLVGIQTKGGINLFNATQEVVLPCGDVR